MTSTDEDHSGRCFTFPQILTSSTITATDHARLTAAITNGTTNIELDVMAQNSSSVPGVPRRAERNES
jgi:hypothetical protein